MKSLVAVVRSSGVLGVALAAFTWPSHPALSPQAGLDPSWTAALAMAAHRGVPYGTRAVFTYGPLGFLTPSQTLFFPWTSICAFVFSFAVVAAVYGVLIRAVRTRSSVFVAVLVAIVAGSPLLWVWPSLTESLLSLAFVLFVAVLATPVDEAAPTGIWIALGSLAAICALSKASVGVSVFALCAIALTCTPRLGRRVVAALGISFIGVFALGWFVTGNGFGNLIPYAQTSAAEVSGYPSAMYADVIFKYPLPGRHYDWWLILLGSIGLAVAAYQFCLQRPVRTRSGAMAGKAIPSEPAHRVANRRTAATPEASANLGLRAVIGIGVATALLLWILFKEGSIRQNSVVFFASLPVLLAAFVPWRRDSRLRGLSGPATITAMLASAFVAFAFAGYVPLQLIQPIEAVRGLGNEAGTLLSASRRDRVTETARAKLQASYALTPSMLAAIDGKTVAIDPFEQMVAWAYPQIRWDTLPVLQDYAAYTSSLDKLDSDFLASSKAPQFILRQVPIAIDGRVPVFDPPATQLAFQCRYRQLQVSDKWQLLERGPNRCGPMRLLGTVHSAYGKVVDVPNPPPGTAMVATFDLHLPLDWKLLNILYKPPGVNIVLNGVPAGNRLIAETATQPHLLQAPDSIGYAATFKAPAITSLSLHMAGRSDGGRVDVSFFAVPVN